MNTKACGSYRFSGLNSIHESLNCVLDLPDFCSVLLLDFSTISSGRRKALRRTSHNPSECRVERARRVKTDSQRDLSDTPCSARGWEVEDLRFPQTAIHQVARPQACSLRARATVVEVRGSHAIYVSQPQAVAQVRKCPFALASRLSPLCNGEGFEESSRSYGERWKSWESTGVSFGQY